MPRDTVTLIRPCIGDDGGDEVDVMMLVMGRSNYLIRLLCAELDVSSMNVTVTYSAHADCRWGLVRFVLYGLVSDGW